MLSIYYIGSIVSHIYASFLCLIGPFYLLLYFLYILLHFYAFLCNLLLFNITNLSLFLLSSIKFCTLLIFYHVLIQQLLLSRYMLRIVLINYYVSLNYPLEREAYKRLLSEFTFFCKHLYFFQYYIIKIIWCYYG